MNGKEFLRLYGKKLTELAIVDQLDYSHVELQSGQWVACGISDDGTEFTTWITDGNSDYGVIENYGYVSLESDVDLDEPVMTIENLGCLQNALIIGSPDDFCQYDDDMSDKIVILSDSGEVILQESRELLGNFFPTDRIITPVISDYTVTIRVEDIFSSEINTVIMELDKCIEYDAPHWVREQYSSEDIATHIVTTDTDYVFIDMILLMARMIDGKLSKWTDLPCFGDKPPVGSSYPWWVYDGHWCIIGECANDLKIVTYDYFEE